MTLRLLVTALTHPGLVREHNEDAVSVGKWFAPGTMTAPRAEEVDLEGVAVCLIADGLGGQAGGEVASALTVLRLATQGPRLLEPGGVGDAVRDVHVELAQRMTAEPELHGMGTTLIGLAAQGVDAVLFNVGDSRGYREDGGYLAQLSVDDSLPGAALSHVVTQTIGGGRDVRPPDPHLHPLRLTLGDRYLLCSDGLTDYARLDDIEKAFGDDDDAAALRLLDAAFAGGGGDNVSLLIIRVIAPEAPDVDATPEDPEGSMTSAQAVADEQRLADPA